MTVWLCSGQGAQKPGMGADLLDIPEVSETFAVMSEGLGVDLADLSRAGSEEEVNSTEVAQALTMAVSVGIGKALMGQGLRPDALIGFSLGQMSALVLSGMLSLDEATKLLKVRSVSMSAACADNPGGMMALMGATLDEAEDLCAQAAGSDVLVCANHNAPGQIVVSGHDGALERAQQQWKELGKRSKRLATAGPFHSPLMAPAATEVERFCSSLNFQEPEITVICNTDAKPFLVAEAAKRMGAQVQSGVLFEESVRALIEKGESDFVEVGFGGVLTNLVKRIDKETTRHAVGTREQLETYIAEEAK